MNRLNADVRPMAVMEHPVHESDSQDRLVRAVLSVLHERTGVDFAQYRTGTVTRRIHNRMISAGIDSLEAYLSHLRASHDETLPLVERLTIKVSRFYRNRATFDLLREQVLPDLARCGRRAGRDGLSIWSAGCGCGEEAYTLAMLLEEHGIPGTVEASDIDPGALDAARAGIYPQAALAELPPAFLSYLEPVAGKGERHRVVDAVRRRLRFSRHDLTAAAPPPGAPFDLVSCRNVLIYFDREAQVRTLAKLRSALSDGGCLCLGEAEWPHAAVAATLATVSAKLRVFRAPAGAVEAANAGAPA